MEPILARARVDRARNSILIDLGVCAVNERYKTTSRIQFLFLYASCFCWSYSIRWISIKTSITSTPLFPKNLGSFNLKKRVFLPHPQFSDLILKELLCDLLSLCITITLRDFDHFDTRQSLTLSDEAATGNGYGALEDARWDMVGRIVRWQKQVLRQKEHIIEVIDGWYITIHTECVYT